MKGISKEEIAARILCPDETAAYDKDMTENDALLEIGEIIGFW